MKSKLLFFSIFSVTLFALATSITLLFNTAPENLVIIASFFISLLLTVFGISYCVLYGFQHFRFRQTAPWQSTMFNLRLSLLISSVMLVFLLLSAYNIFNVATALVTVALAVVSELLWRRRKGFI